jgi:hypothetical protein
MAMAWYVLVQYMSIVYSDVPELLHILCKMALHGIAYINSERTRHKAATLIFSKASLKMKDG